MIDPEPQDHTYKEAKKKHFKRDMTLISMSKAIFLALKKPFRPELNDNNMTKLEVAEIFFKEIN